MEEDLKHSYILKHINERIIGLERNKSYIYAEIKKFRDNIEGLEKGILDIERERLSLLESRSELTK